MRAYVISLEKRPVKWTPKTGQSFKLSSRHERVDQNG